MNIKHLAIALLTTALISTPLFAHTDGDEHTSNIKKMDKATPSSVSTQTTVDADKSKEKGHGMATGKRTHEPLVIKQGIDKASPVAGNETDDNASQSSKASSFGSKISTEGQTHRGSADTNDNDSDSHSSKAFIKIGDIKGEGKAAESDMKLGDIKGESTKANGLSSGAIAGIVIGVIKPSNSDGDSAGDEDDPTDDTEPKSTNLSKKGYDHYQSSNSSNAAGVIDTDSSETSKEVECDAETQKKVCDEALDPDTCVLTTSVCHF